MHLAPGVVERPAADPEPGRRAARDARDARRARRPRASIHVAPPDHHLLLGDGTLVLSRGPTENGHRPAINATFRSAAVTAGPAAIGVVLSGALDDGSAGLCFDRRAGRAWRWCRTRPTRSTRGCPRTPSPARRPSTSTRSGVLGGVLDKLVRAPVDPVEAPPPSPALLLEDRIARDGVRADAVIPGETTPASGHSCPDCGGALARGRPAWGALPLPDRARLVGRSPARRARPRVRAGAVDGPALPRRKGGTGPADAAGRGTPRHASG